MDEELKTAFKNLIDSAAELDTSLRKYCNENNEEQEKINSAIEAVTITTIENHKKLWEKLG